MPATEEITIRVAGKILGGWSLAQVRVGVEIFPAEFSLITTSQTLPGLQSPPYLSGVPVEAWLGQDKILTGWLDVVSPPIGPSRIELTGRGRCADLVDCSAEVPGGQIMNQNLFQVAETLCAPYGIRVRGEGDPGDPIPNFNLILGETPVSIIDRVAKYRQKLFYENRDGELVITDIGTRRAAGGLIEGGNILSGRILSAAHMRYSEVVAVRTSLSISAADSTGGDNWVSAKIDPEVGRHRRLYVVAETGDGDFKVVEKRAAWEVSRRKGRALQVSISVDSWRDAAGALWEPNTLTAVKIPSRGIDQEMVISSVVFNQGLTGGTTADLLVMPKDAYAVQPVVVIPIIPDLTSAATSPPD